ASEASHETTVDSWRSSGPRPLGPDGPLPHSADRSVGEKSKRDRVNRTSPPWNGSGTGEYGRRPGGGASEASQETTVDSRRSSGPRPLGPDGPLPHSANRSVGEKSEAPSGQVPRPKAGRVRERSELSADRPGGRTICQERRSTIIAMP